MYFLGIDGGGSQTRALLCDRYGNLVGRGFSGPSNPCTQTPKDCFDHLCAATLEALSSEGLDSLKNIQAAHLGIAGVADESALQIIRTAAQELFLGAHTKLSFSHDLKTAHVGGHAGAPGITLIAGTGSACFGVNAAGSEQITGGWGDFVDDAGSGAWIGLQALQVCVRQADGRLSGDSLQRCVLEFLSISSMDTFKSRFHLMGLPRKQRAELAPTIIKLAQSGESTARTILQKAFDELTALVLANVTQIRLAKPRIQLLGGLNKNPYFRGHLQKTIQVAIPDAIFTHTRLSAAKGALLLALRNCSQIPDDTILQNMESASDS